jgi:hypothetical protein
MRAAAGFSKAIRQNPIRKVTQDFAECSSLKKEGLCHCRLCGMLFAPMMSGALADFLTWRRNWEWRTWGPRLEELARIPCGILCATVYIEVCFLSIQRKGSTLASFPLKGKEAVASCHHNRGTMVPTHEQR